MFDRLLDSMGTNWKSVAGGIAMILVGVAGLTLTMVAPDNPHAMPFEAAVGLIAAGLSALGITHKVERSAREQQTLRLEQRWMREELQQLKGGNRD